MYLFASLFIVAGTSHFLLDRFFLRIMPKWVPFPKFVNYASGLAEILLGLLLFPDLTRSYAAWLLFALLLAVWPANFYHYFSRNKMDPPKWVLLARLPLQIPLLYWAYSFTW
ncbi:DoxX-like family protein [Leptospira idonii]|uniref:DoxX-like family protein n=2 Tax=Leptospira idonii TaxID=1193500 RepID=A0A4R9LUV8_9LEPT|nr:DoxX-like family protein [Leptospira idonii]